MVCVQISFNLESHVVSKFLGAFADQQVVVGVFHHRLSHQRRRAHAFERAHGASAFLWPMHAGRIQLHDAFGIWQSTVPNAVVQWIEFYDIDSGNYGIKHVGALSHQSEGLLDGGHVAAIFEAISVS